MSVRGLRRALRAQPRWMRAVLASGIVEVMDACRAAGIERIGIVTAPDRTT